MEIESGRGVLEGKAAMVTGSSRGIGRVIALRLAGEGAKVVICCRSTRDKAEEVAKEVAEMGVSATVVQSDISTTEGAKEAVSHCLEAYGKVDILVNNAGTFGLRLIDQLDEEELLRVVGTNLLSCFHTSAAAVPHMVERGEGGVIINISSILGMIGIAGGTAYAASKAGVNGFTVCLARELARHGIRVNGVAPGYVRTEMTEWLSPDYWDKVLPRIPMRRLAEPEEIAEVVEFLVARGTYITGQTLVVDGGIMID